MSDGVEFSIEDLGTADYLEVVRQNILTGIREATQEGIADLGSEILGHLGGDPVVSRSGEFADRILTSQNVSETSTAIKGSISTMVGRKPMGVWLEDGVDVPATIGTAKGVLYQFTPADGDSRYTHGHQAFQVAPHPFLRESMANVQPTIIDLIAARVQGAVDAATV